MSGHKHENVAVTVKINDIKIEINKHKYLCEYVHLYKYISTYMCVDIYVCTLNLKKHVTYK